MEKLRSECEARGEHLPEVPSFQISCSFPRWVSMEIWAGCRFLMGVTIFVRGWAQERLDDLHYCWRQLWDPNFWSTKIFKRNGVYCLKPGGLSTQRPKGWTLKNHGRFYHRSTVCMENVRFPFVLSEVLFSPNAMGMVPEFVIWFDCRNLPFSTS